MRVFQQAVDYVLEDEGGYVDDPHDKGGETNWGISKRAYPDLNIAALTREQAIDIYHRDYWRPAGCDRLPPPLALCVFDAAVNMGVQTAIRHLQYAVGVVQDGIVGPATERAAWDLSRHVAIERMLGKRILGYAGMGSFGRFGGGWIARVLRTQRRALLTDWGGDR